MQTVRQSVDTVLVSYQTMTDQDAWVSATDWINGEGIDISICSDGRHQMVSVSEDDADAIMGAIIALRMRGRMPSKAKENGGA